MILQDNQFMNYMHGKNSEISQGLKMIFPNRSQDFISHKKFGFNVIIETMDELNNKTEKSSEFHDKETKLPPIYSNNVLIYHSILKYSINFGTKNYFKSREISKNWILDNCKVYKKEYEDKDFKKKTKKGARVERMNPKIIQSLENLRYLELLESKETRSSNNEKTTEYKFTELGKLFGLLIEYINESTDISIVDKIYQQFLEYYNSQSYTHSKFCSIFFKECFDFDKRIFSDIIIAKFVEILNKSSEDKKFFFRQLRNFPVFYKHSLMCKLFLKSLQKFHSNFPDHYRIWLYNFKLEMEQVQERKCKNFTGFEKWRIENRSLPEIITVEGYCKICKMYTDVEIEILRYIEAYVQDPKKGIMMSCLVCNSNDGFSLEIF